MLYYVLDAETGTFVVKTSASKVASYLLGASITGITIFKSDPDGTRSYCPENGDVTKIEKELEAL